ncbi:MAG: hypothetical protein AAFR82_08645 [Pseudomonadota bacterium]
MTDPMTVLSRKIDGRDVHRRQHRKSDGRDLLLYGYQANRLQPVEGDDLQTITGSELRWHPLRGDWSIYAAALGL